MLPLQYSMQQLQKAQLLYMTLSMRRAAVAWLLILPYSSLRPNVLPLGKLPAVLRGSLRIAQQHPSYHPTSWRWTVLLMM